MKSNRLASLALFFVTTGCLPAKQPPSPNHTRVESTAPAHAKPDLATASGSAKQTSKPASETTTAKTAENVDAPAAIDDASAVASAPPKALTPTALVAQANNSFGLALYRRLATGSDGNLALSPASLSMALAMTAAGARATTAQEMLQTLGAQQPTEALHQGWAALNKQWQGDSDVELRTANRLFGDNHYTFEPPFLSHTKKHYGAGLLPVDFAGNPQAQRRRINQWVTQQTGMRIRQLIPPEGVGSNTRLALVNALYFKAKWSQPFNTRHTQTSSFTLASGKQVQAPTMHNTFYMNYGSTNGHHVAELDYRGGRFGAVFVLPKGGNFAALEAKLNLAHYTMLSHSLKPARVHIAIPKFRIEPAQSSNLKQQLVAMGMREAFSLRADFSGITKPQRAADRLRIENVFHKAFIKVDEAGSEATAATAVMMGRKGASKIPPKEFKLNRPFLFMIRDKKTHTILFIARVMHPKG